MKKLKNAWILLFTKRSIVKEENLKGIEQKIVKVDDFKFPENGDCLPEHLFTKKKYGSYH